MNEQSQVFTDNEELRIKKNKVLILLLVSAATTMYMVAADEQSIRLVAFFVIYFFWTVFLFGFASLFTGTMNQYRSVQAASERFFRGYAMIFLNILACLVALPFLFLLSSYKFF